MSLQEDQFQLFISSVQNYFNQVAGNAPEFSPPYILDNPLTLKEFTGSISVSGNHNGIVLFTADNALLDDLLGKLGENRRDADVLGDVIGEVANTISGNFRREFGQHFVISTPRVSADSTQQIAPKPNTTTYVVPLRWSGREALLVVDFQRAAR